jgi:molybdopterin molybdotransferase
MNVPWVMVRRRPKIALLATGDEIVRPGEPLAANQIVSSNALALAALVKAGGGEAIDLGIAKDNEASLKAMAAGARGADMLVTLGGASVGDHDLVQSVLGEQGLEIDFWRIAMRPGKPLMFGRINDSAMMGMPGNPVSSLVCGLIFLRPAIRAMLGIATPDENLGRARLAEALPANDRRQDYLRAEFQPGNGDGAFLVKPFGKQDSSMLSLLARSDCLVIRPPYAKPAKVGDDVEIIHLNAAT